MLGATQIGIDLGQYEIKIAQVEEVSSMTGELNRLKEYESYPVNCEMYSKEYFTLLKKSIKHFSKKIKKPMLSLNFILPVDEHTNTIFMNVPSVSEKDLDAGVKFEVEQRLVGQSVLDYQYVWKILNEYEELNEYEILLATLNSDVIKAISKFKTINWKVNRIMLQPIILERFAKNNDIIVDFGYKQARIYMYKEGKLAEIQSVEIGSYNVEKDIEAYIEEHNIELDEDIYEIMGKLHVQNQFIEEDELINNMSSAIEPLISRLIDEIKRNIRSFELKNGLNIENIYYMGGLFNLNYLDMKLEAELDSSIMPLNIVSKDFDDIKYDLAALAMISPEIKDRMDFSKFAKINIDYTSILTGAVATSLSVALALGLLNGKYESVIEEQIALEANQSQTISSLDGEISMQQGIIAESERFINKIESLKNQRKWLSDALYVIPDITPLSVAITDLKIIDKVVEIEGYSADYSAIGFFANELEQFGDVEIQIITDYNSDGSPIYSVVTDNPETISDKYLMTKNFKIVLNHRGDLMER